MRAHGAASWKDSAARASGLGIDRRGLFLIPLLALFLIHPLILGGCSCGHDFDFHLLSWFEAATQISHGNLHPHWAYTPAWDAGEPRFVFYPPLCWYLGALVGLVLSHLPGVSEASAWTAAPIVFTWIALTVSGLTMYHLARRYAGACGSLLASATYIANPYMLFTAYERTAYGELLAAAWMPLLLEGILRERPSIPRIAIPVALLWLTNAPAAVMGCYALALLAFVRICAPSAAELHDRRPLLTLKIAGGATLGLALAGFYIVPAAFERRYVQAAMATVGGMRIDANFLFEHTGNTPDDLLHDQVLRTASWIAVLLVAVTVGALAAAWMHQRKRTRRRLPIAPLAILIATVAFFLTPLTAPLWHHLPEMAFLQFPWRLLALLTPVMALAIAVALARGSNKNQPASAKSPVGGILISLSIAAALGLPAYRLFRQTCDPEDTAAARLALFHSSAGTDPTDEYTPITADNDALHPYSPSWWLAKSFAAGAPAAQTSASLPRSAPMHLAIDAPRAEFLILDLRDYPAWRITLARLDAMPQPVTGREPRADGLIAIPVPAGRSTINIRYAQTADQTAGDAISLVAVLVTLACVRPRRTAAMRPA